MLKSLRDVEKFKDNVVVGRKDQGRGGLLMQFKQQVRRRRMCLPYGWILLRDTMAGRHEGVTIHNHCP